jgi:hypothetical protein
VFTGTSDGIINRSFRLAPESHIYEFKNQVKVTATPVAISTTGDKKGIYVLENNNSIAHIDGETFTIINEVEIKGYDATSLSYSI